MRPDAARDFRLQLRLARETALKDAEAFHDIIHVVERLGSFLYGPKGDLGKYKDKIEELAELSPLATDVPAKLRSFHTPFGLLYDIVRNARNDALHIGAFARHLTTHAIEMALILEDALMICEHQKYVTDYMVRDPICAHPWQPISFVRQTMLANSFSYLPVKNAGGDWCVVSDEQIAKYLHGNERRLRLATPLEEAIQVVPIPVKRFPESTTIDSALEKFDGKPILIIRDDDKSQLTGILTAFDLL